MPTKAERLKEVISFLEDLHQDMVGRPGAYIHARIDAGQVNLYKESLQQVLAKRLSRSAQESLQQIEAALEQGQSIRALVELDESGGEIVALYKAWLEDTDERVSIHAIQWLLDYNKLKMRDWSHQQDQTWLVWLVPTQVKVSPPS